MFGSVPLKTFLPGGDLDVVIVGSSEVLRDDNAWTERVRAGLDGDAATSAPMHDLVVRDMQIVHAEVKVMKCMVRLLYRIC